MLITKDQGKRIAGAAVRTNMLAENPCGDVSLTDALTLERSYKPSHQIDAGWLCLHLFERQLEQRRRKSDLVGRARTIWTKVVDNDRASCLDRMHAVLAESHSRLWVRAAEGKTSWDERTETSYRESIQHIQSFLEGPSQTYSEGEFAGALAEAISAVCLNAFAIAEGKESVTVPAESWNDCRHINAGSNFDLWQASGRHKKKVQVKFRHSKGNDDEVEYDSDIAVVYFEDHWPGEHEGEMLRTFLQISIDDQDLIGVGASMQQSIDRHFRQ